MAILDRFRKQENSINEKPVLVNGFNLFGLYTGERGKYSDAYVWLVLKPIVDALHNVRFFVENVDKTQLLQSYLDIKKAIDFIDRNITLLWWQGVNKGFYAIGEKNGSYYVLKNDEIRYKPDNVSVDEVASGAKYVYYLDKYQLTGKSDFDFLRENLRTIDIFKDGDLNLTASGGAIGMLTGKGLPMNKRDKEIFERELKDTFGIEGRKRQIIVSNLEMDFKQMKLDVKDLQLIEKIREEIKLLCGFFGVPYDLVPFSGASTYANQREAKTYFYRNTLSAIAESLLHVLRKMVINTKHLIPSDRVTFTFDNVPELANDRTSEIAFAESVLNVIEKARSLNIDTTQYEKLLKS